MPPSLFKTHLQKRDTGGGPRPHYHPWDDSFCVRKSDEALVAVEAREQISRLHSLSPSALMSETTSNERSPRSRWPLLLPLKVRNYRLLWLGSVVSMIGSNLTIIAFPWLVLKLTGDSLAMGIVLAISGVPRAVFMIAGGAIVDRWNPRVVLMWSSILRMMLLFLLAVTVQTELVNMPTIYVVAFLFGVVDAFSWPASSAILPRVVKVDLLPPANALMQGMMQLSVMFGPVLAGVLIAAFSAGGEEVSADLPGIALVFFVDSFGFLFSAITLFLIQLPALVQGAAGRQATILKSVIEGFSATWRDVPVRLMVIIFSVFTFFFRGPYMVGIPVLADLRFDEGALAFGMISSAFGVGALIGTLLAGSMPRPPERWYGPLLLIDLMLLGLTFFVYATAPNVEWAMGAAVVGALIDGYMTVLLMSWFQARIPSHLLGRVMSVVMFCNNGLAPLSYALAGALIRISLEGVFWGAGIILVFLGLLSLMFRTTRTLGLR